ncbi:MAG TPA: hypothetical protein PKD76_03925 [Solirubrobacterales bacterium]|nr:hypothetical protein [Solirubrobacterales bacterium]
MFSSRSNFRRTFATIAVGGVAAVSFVACGGDSKPAFCDDRTQFDESVKALPGLIADSDPSGLQTQIETIETNAGTLADSAKADFPSETEAIETSVETLRKGVDALPANPTRTDYAAVGLSAAMVVSAITNFNDATKSECE